MPSIACIVGNRRPENYTAKALTVVSKELETLGASINVYDGRSMTLAFPDEPDTKDAILLREGIKQADAVVFATPEYQGCFSAYAKLIIENLGYPSALQGKVISLLGVASGRIGATKSLEQLRITCAHIGGVVLPQAVSVSDVQSVFSKDGQCTNPHVENMLHQQARDLLAFLDR